MKIIGATLGWSGFPQLCYEKQEKFSIFKFKIYVVLPYSYEILKYAEYYPDGPYSWPKDPLTGEKLEIVK